MAPTTSPLLDNPLRTSSLKWGRLAAATILEPGATMQGQLGTRDQILGLIEREPGLHKTALCDATGLAWGTVDYHLKLLARAGRVTLARIGRETRCFPGQLAPQNESLLATLTSGPAARIALALRHMPGQGVGALSEQLGLSSKVVRRHLLRLVDTGVLVRAGFHRPRYQVRPEAEPLLAANGLLRHLRP